jgi:hypothetical protein
MLDSRMQEKWYRNLRMFIVPVIGELLIAQGRVLFEEALVHSEKVGCHNSTEIGVYKVKLI